MDTFKSEVIAGLRQSPKRIPSKFFYDERGSQLFEAITELPEYYLTRTEISILTEYLPEMVHLIGPDATIIEFGTGAGLKTKLLLEGLEHPHTYIPIDISPEQLKAATAHLAASFPDLEVHPIVADYTTSIELPRVSSGGRSVVFFPGSTIGNFTPAEAVDFLQQAAKLLQHNGGLLIGFDLVKDATVLEAAYDDSRGITAEFNKNLITRINKEFGVPISPEDFDHFAYFNSAGSRVEMHLVSHAAQSLQLDGNTIELVRGEHIITEYSYKYTPEAFREILLASGFEIQARWHDAQNYFEVCYATTDHK